MTVKGGKNLDKVYKERHFRGGNRYEKELVWLVEGPEETRMGRQENVPRRQEEEEGKPGFQEMVYFVLTGCFLV